MTKISALNPDTAPTLDDYVVTVDQATNTDKRVTILDLLNAKSGVTITVSADGKGDYPTIQQALDAVPSGGAHVIVQAGTYTVTDGLIIKQAGTVLEGEGLNTLIYFSGLGFTDGIEFNANDMEGCQIRNMWLARLDNYGNGNAINFSNQPLSLFENIRIDHFNIGLYANDTANLTFYNTFRNFTIACNTGIQLKGNPVNDNTFESFRINCTGGGGGKGLDLQNGNGNTFVRLNCEPNPGAGITGVSLGATTYSNTFVGVYCEGNATGLSITSGALYNCFFGGEVTANTADISDSGTGTIFLGVDTTGAVFKNQLGSLTTKDLQVSLTGSSTATEVLKATVDTSDATQTALLVKNNTNFAHTGDIIKGQMVNGSDSGRVMRLENAGTGKTISATNGTNETYSLDKTGVVNLIANTAITSGGAKAAQLGSGTVPGIYVGSGIPTISAAQGSIYLRSEGSSSSTRAYINTNGTTGWTAITTAA